MNRIFKSSLIAVLGFSAFTLGSCKKSFLETKPTDQVATSEVFKTVEGAEAALQGIHRTVYEVADHDAFGFPSIALMWDLMGEDMSLSGGGSGWFVGAYRLTDARTPDGTGSYMWGFFYRIINNANYILANVDKIETNDESRRDFVKAGALFYRAWAYYNLANCYMFTYAGSSTVPVPVPGSGMGVVSSFKEAACVPIYTEPTTAENHQANPRASVQEVYDRIVSDLDAALALYAVSDRGRADKSEINIDVAKGLYARVALVMQNWPKAEQMAREARANYAFATGVNVNDGFNNAKNSEWIWGSIINTEQTGLWASFLSQMDWDMGLYAAGGQEKRINTDLFNNQIDTTDLRRAWWISREQKRAGAPYAAYSQRKFRVLTTASTAGDFPMMRASEMALIEAEAMAMQGNTGGAITVLNDFGRTRQASYDASGLGATDLVKEIWLQRRIELWGEGFRYFDLQRSFATFPVSDVQNTTGMQRSGAQGHNSQLASIMSVGQYGYDYLFRIPGNEREQNPQVMQNP